MYNFKKLLIKIYIFELVLLKYIKKKNHHFYKHKKRKTPKFQITQKTTKYFENRTTFRMCRVFGEKFQRLISTKSQIENNRSRYCINILVYLITFFHRF